MMPEISLHILDIAENSVRAGASRIAITVEIQTKADWLRVCVRDNGKGMEQEQVAQVTDPFFTTRTTRKVGLGVPFLKQAAESAGGQFRIVSEPQKGTSVEATFQLSHIDRMPLGDINAVIHTLIVFHETIEFCYEYRYNQRFFVLDTSKMRDILGEVSFQTPEVSAFIKEYLSENQRETETGNGGSI